MAKLSYNTTTKKVQKLFEEIKENNTVVSNELKRMRIKYEQVNNNKKLTRIKIAEKQLGNKVGSSFESLAFHIEFQNFPDEFILFTRIFQYFSVDDAFDMSNMWSTSSENMQYWWERKDDGRAILHGRVHHSSPRTTILNATVFNAPVYHTVELIILNEGLYHELQTSKK